MSHWRSLRFDFFAMASPCSLQMDGQDERLLRQAARAARAEVQRIEQKFSRYRDTSVVSRINAAAGLQSVSLDTETQGLLDFAQALWQQSDGLFDATSGVLRRVWDFKNGKLPDAAQLQSVLSLVGWQHVRRSGKRVRLRHTGMELDFGGFGKEYAADRAAAVLHQHGVVHALVNLGGDLHALGARGLPECVGAPWQIDIAHPRQAPDQAVVPLARLPLTRGALATSGDYERFFIQDGHRYCHILNPRTGRPVTHWQSVSVLAANTVTAGALSTIAMLKGAVAPAWLDEQNVSYLLVSHDGQLVRSAMPAAP